MGLTLVVADLAFLISFRLEDSDPSSCVKTCLERSSFLACSLPVMGLTLLVAGDLAFLMPFGLRDLEPSSCAVAALLEWWSSFPVCSLPIMGLTLVVADLAFVPEAFALVSFRLEDLNSSSCVETCLERSSFPACSLPVMGLVAGDLAFLVPFRLEDLGPSPCVMALLEWSSFPACSLPVMGLTLVVAADLAILPEAFAVSVSIPFVRVETFWRFTKLFDLMDSSVPSFVACRLRLLVGMVITSAPLTRDTIIMINVETEEAWTDFIWKNNMTL